jgi:hypothetical protein
LKNYRKGLVGRGVRADGAGGRIRNKSREKGCGETRKGAVKRIRGGGK